MENFVGTYLHFLSRYWVGMRKQRGTEFARAWKQVIDFYFIFVFIESKWNKISDFSLVYIKLKLSQNNIAVKKLKQNWTLNYVINELIDMKLSTQYPISVVRCNSAIGQNNALPSPRHCYYVSPPPRRDLAISPIKCLYAILLHSDLPTVFHEWIQFYNSR